MVEQFTNDRPYPVEIPRFGITVQPGAQFEIPDEDAGSLNDDFPMSGTDGVLLTEGSAYLMSESGDLLAA